jgi:hypothetical protein
MTPQLAEVDVSEWDNLFAELFGDAGLAERTRSHARVLAVWWAVRLRQELVAPTWRLAGVEHLHEPSTERLAALCERRAAALLGL